MPNKIMIIDDSVLVLTIVRAQLEEAGFDVITRESSLGTVAAVLREQPDVILVDVMMPALGGENLVPLLRKQPDNRDVRILFFSDKPPETLQAMAQRAGADGFVTKGTPPEMLVSRVHAALKTRSRPEAAASRESAVQDVETYALFVDRDPGLRALCPLMAPLGAAGFLQSGHEALQILQGTQPPTYVFAGAHLLDMRGEDLWIAAIAVSPSWRDKIVLMSDAEHPVAAPAPGAAPGPKWVPRPVSIADVERVQAAMRRQ